MKKRISIALGAAVSLGFLYLAFRNVDREIFLRSFSGADWRWFFPLALLVIADLLIRGLKWKILLAPLTRAGFYDCFRLQSIGLALNNVLPFRLGELARAAFAANLFRLPVLTVISTIVVERVLDLLVIVGLFLAAAALGGMGDTVAQYAHFFWAGLGGVLLAVGALVFAEEVADSRLLRRFFRRLPALEKALRQAAQGAKALHRPRAAIIVILLGFFQWSLSILSLYFAATAFGIEGMLTFTRGVTLLFASVMAVSVPGVPGYFGNLEYAIAGVMAGWGLDMNIGVAMAGWMHIGVYAVQTVAGLFFLYWMGQSLGRVWRDLSGYGKQ
ncbi:MAG: hypothetical protein FD189_877 [Elusimicrobia bacterium]|nr:MAG: hypothetical protein FD154_956 [Elusimicrobiota bacterium]KAF0156737.1 MAG: hypothetical protein FD189_877 [Elusimicrobiota bacterium]